MADTSHDSVGKKQKSPVRATKPKPPGKERKPLLLKEKAWIIEQREHGRKPSDIAKEISRQKTTIYTVLSQKTIIMTEWRKGSTSLTRERFRRSGQPEVEAALLEWFREKRTTSSDVVISHAMLQQKAMDIARHMNFRRRHSQQAVDSFHASRISTQSSAGLQQVQCNDLMNR